MKKISTIILSVLIAISTMNTFVIHASESKSVLYATRTTNTNATGTVNDPMSITKALNEIDTNGTIRIVGNVDYYGYGSDTDPTAPYNKLPAKNITIEGADENATFLYTYSLVLGGNLTFRNIKLQPLALNESDIFCEGHNLTYDGITMILSAAKQTPSIVAGSRLTTPIRRDNQIISLNSGSYKAIYAGGYSAVDGPLTISLSNNVVMNAETTNDKGIYGRGLNDSSVTGDIKVKINGWGASRLDRIVGNGSLIDLELVNTNMSESTTRLEQVKSISLYQNTNFSYSNLANLKELQIDSSSTWEVLDSQSLETLKGDGKIKLDGNVNRLAVSNEISGTFNVEFSKVPNAGTMIKGPLNSSAEFKYQHKMTVAPYDVGTILTKEVSDTSTNWNIMSYQRVLKSITFRLGNDATNNTIVLEDGFNKQRRTLLVESRDQYQSAYYNTKNYVSDETLEVEDARYQGVIDDYQLPATYIMNASNTRLPAGDMKLKVSFMNNVNEKISGSYTIRFMVKPVVQAAITNTDIINNKVVLHSTLSGADSFQGELIVKDKSGIEYKRVSLNNGKEADIEVPMSMIQGKEVQIVYSPTDSTYYVENQSNFLQVEEMKPITSIVLSDKLVTLPINNTVQLNAVLNPSDTSDSKNLTWKSDNTQIASVSTSGLVKGSRPGKTVITVTSSNGLSDTCEVTITSPITSISLSHKTASFKINSTFQLNAVLNPSDTSDSKNLIWKSDNTQIASVSTSGLVKGLRPGKTVITVTSSNGLSDTCEVTITSSITSISLSHKTASLKINSTVQLNAVLNPSDTSDSKNLTWKSDNTQIASVSTSGLVKGLRPGKTTIRVTSSNGLTDACVVTITSPITSIKLSKSSVMLYKGYSTTLYVSFAPIDTTDSKTITWTSSNTKVITVSKGVVKAINPGNATVTARSVNGKVATCKVYVKGPITSVTLNASSIMLQRYKTKYLTARINPSDTYQSKTIRWSSSNTKVVTVDSKGKVTAKGKGVAYIYAKSVNGKVARCRVSVQIPITSVRLNIKSVTLKRGRTKQLIASVSPTYTTYSKAIKWKSSNTRIASVSSKGKIYAKARGYVVITGTTSNGKKAYCKVYVR